MKDKPGFEQCFRNSALILTEGAVGQRIEHEFHRKPDRDIMYAGLIYEPAGRNALATIYCSYLEIAQQYDLPIMLMTNTRRANQERVLQSKYHDRNVMGDFTCFLRDLASRYACRAYIGGMMGCRGNAYSASEGLTTEAAIEYHSWQLRQFPLDDLDFLFAGIMPTLPEAAGMANVMEGSGKPYIISLMINRTGSILDGTTIHDVIQTIDQNTKRQPLCYMTNCVHPSILQEALMNPVNQTRLVQQRFCGIQANAACLDAELLDQCDELQTSSPEQLLQSFVRLRQAFSLKILGGCCGTDDRHIREIANTFGAAAV